MANSKFWTIVVSVVVLLIAAGIGIGGFTIIQNNKPSIEKYSKIKTEKKKKKDIKQTAYSQKTLDFNELDLQDYMKKTHDKLKKNWNSNSDKSGKVVLSYTINKDGSLMNYKIVSSEGSKDLEQDAINALKKSVPFEPLPKSYKSDNILVQFTFDYDVAKK